MILPGQRERASTRLPEKAVRGAEEAGGAAPIGSLATVPGNHVVSGFGQRLLMALPCAQLTCRQACELGLRSSAKVRLWSGVTASCRTWLRGSRSVLLSSFGLRYLNRCHPSGLPVALHNPLG